jgi:hypothetical protein
MRERVASDLGLSCVVKLFGEMDLDSFLFMFGVCICTEWDDDWGEEGGMMMRMMKGGVGGMRKNCGVPSSINCYGQKNSVSAISRVVYSDGKVVPTADQ